MVGGDRKVSRCAGAEKSGAGLKAGYMLLRETAEEAVGPPVGTRMGVGYAEG
jgi:hypothetical protein